MENIELKKEEIKKYYEVLANTSPDCIKLFDLDGNLLYINNGGLKEHGLESLEKAVNDKWNAIDSVIPEDKPAFIKAFESALKGEISTLELTHKEGASDREICLETVAPVKDDEGKIIGIFGVSRDITDIKKGREKLQGKISELEEINKIMVGRELKMIELKKEIEKLKNQDPKLI